MPEQVKSNRGGARAGSGRPRKAPTATIAVRVPIDIAEKFWTIVDQEQTTARELVTKWVSSHPKPTLEDR